MNKIINTIQIHIPAEGSDDQIMNEFYVELQNVLDDLENRVQ